MRHRLLNLAAGYAIGALAPALLSPRVVRGDGSGSDENGDYNYRWAKIRIGALVLELHHWVDRIER